LGITLRLGVQGLGAPRWVPADEPNHGMHRKSNAVLPHAIQGDQQISSGEQRANGLQVDRRLRNGVEVVAHLLTAVADGGVIAAAKNGTDLWE
jgi:hypothetical protein